MSSKVKALESSLYDWQTSAILVAKSDTLRVSLGNQALLREGAVFREAYIAGKFADHVNADFVRLLRPQERPTPDFALQIDEAELWFESTEADRPSRKRNLEYSQPEGVQSVRSLTEDEWVDQSAYSEEIDRLCRQKASKRYDKCDGLIINSNAFGIIDEHLIDEAWWRRSTRAAHSRFGEVWRFHQSAFSQIS